MTYIVQVKGIIVTVYMAIGLLTVCGPLPVIDISGSPEAQSAIGYHPGQVTDQTTAAPNISLTILGSCNTCSMAKFMFKFNGEGHVTI